MTAKHTEGPWGRNIPPASKYPVIYAGRNTHVAQVLSKGLPDAEVEANANLIAAAPELLAALKLARSVIAECRKRIPATDHDDGIPVELFIDAAIAKAEGEPE